MGGGCTGTGPYSARREKNVACLIVQMFLKQSTSVGAPTIDTMVGEPQLVVKNTCVCLSNLSSKTKYDAVLYTQSWGANMQCNTQAHHHEHTNDGHANVVMHRMQYAIT